MIVTFYSLDHFGTTRLIDGSEEAIQLNEAPGEDWIEGNWLGTHYVDASTLEPHPLREMDLSVSVNLVEGIPAGATVTVDAHEDPYVVEDGVLEIESEFDDVLRVNVRHPHYRPSSVMVTCEGP